MAQQPSLIPGNSAVVEKDSLTLSSIWYRWLYSLWARVITCAATMATVTLSNQAASISATSAYAVNATGLFRVSYIVRITTAASSSSSATVALGFRTNSLTFSQAFSAVTGNTTTTQQNGSIFVKADAGTTLTYTVTYASVGATAMKFAFDLAVEQVA